MPRASQGGTTNVSDTATLRTPGQPRHPPVGTSRPRRNGGNAPRSVARCVYGSGGFLRLFIPTTYGHVR